MGGGSGGRSRNTSSALLGALEDNYQGGHPTAMTNRYHNRGYHMTSRKPSTAESHLTSVASTEYLSGDDEDAYTSLGDGDYSNADWTQHTRDESVDFYSLAGQSNAEDAAYDVYHRENRVYYDDFHVEETSRRGYFYGDNRYKHHRRHNSLDHYGRKRSDNDHGSIVGGLLMWTCASGWQHWNQTQCASDMDQAVDNVLEASTCRGFPLLFVHEDNTSNKNKQKKKSIVFEDEEKRGELPEGRMAIVKPRQGDDEAERMADMECNEWKTIEEWKEDADSSIIQTKNMDYGSDDSTIGNKTGVLPPMLVVSSLLNKGHGAGHELAPPIYHVNSHHTHVDESNHDNVVHPLLHIATVSSYATSDAAGQDETERKEDDHDKNDSWPIWSIQRQSGPKEQRNETGQRVQDKQEKLMAFRSNEKELQDEEPTQDNEEYLAAGFEQEGEGEERTLDDHSKRVNMNAAHCPETQATTTATNISSAATEAKDSNTQKKNSNSSKKKTKRQLQSSSLGTRNLIFASAMSRRFRLRTSTRS